MQVRVGLQASHPCSCVSPCYILFNLLMCKLPIIVLVHVYLFFPIVVKVCLYIPLSGLLPLLLYHSCYALVLSICFLCCLWCCTEFVTDMLVLLYSYMRVLFILCYLQQIYLHYTHTDVLSLLIFLYWAALLHLVPPLLFVYH
jgi:hypothetical protein